MFVSLSALGFTKNNTYGDILRCFPHSVHTELCERLNIRSLKACLTEEQLETHYSFFDKLIFKSFENADQIAEKLQKNPNKANASFVSAGPIIAAGLIAELKARQKNRKTPKLVFQLDTDNPETVPPNSVNKVKQTITSVIGEVCSFLPKSWISQNLTILLKPGIGSNASHIADILHLPGRYDLDGLLKHPHTYRAIVAHEFGHDIVDEIMSLILPAWKRNTEVKKKAIELNIEAGKLLLQAQQQLDKIKKMQAQNTPADKVDKVSIQTEQLLKNCRKTQRQAFDIEEEYNRELYRTFMPYNELLGDLIAILWSQDKEGNYNPRVIYDAVYSPHARSHISHKEMTKRHRVSQWRDWSQNCRVKGWKRKESHIKLNPTRSYVWDKYLTTAWARRHPTEMLVKIAEAVARAFQEVYHDGEIHKLSPEQANKKLIEHIDNVMKKR